MADFGGFNVQTPQEVLSQLNAQRQQIAQIPNQQARNEANIVFQLSNMFGNPELTKARRLDKSMTAAQRAFESSTGAKPGSLDYEAERLSAMYQATKDIDPLAASQIASQMTQIDEARFERKRLSNIDRRAETQAENAAAESLERQSRDRRKNLQDNTTYIETTDDEGNVSYEAFNLGDDQSRLAFERARLKENTVVLTREEMADRGADYDDADFKLHNNSTFSVKLETLQAAEHSLRQGGRIINVLASNPDANTDFSVIVEKTNDYAQEGKAALSKLQELAGRPGIVEELDANKIKSVLNTVEWYTNMDAQDREAVEGLTLNMAYVLARSLDPSGRLSDADVMFAAKMMASTNGDPRVLARVMTEQVVSNADKWRRAERRDLDTLTSRQRANNSQARRMDAVLDGIDQGIAGYRKLLVDDTGIMAGDQFDRILTPYALEPARPGQAAIRPTNPEDQVDGAATAGAAGITID